MFKRRWKWFGDLVSDEGFSLRYGHRSVYHSDERGSFELPFEDGFLFPRPFQTAGEPLQLNQVEVVEIIERVVRGIKAEGHEVQVFLKSPDPPG
jgi:hypothetical protein